MVGQEINKEVIYGETPLSGLRKALEMIKSSNTNFRTVNMRGKNVEDSEVTELKKEEEERKKELR